MAPKVEERGGGSQCSRQFCTNLAFRDCDYFNLVSRQLIELDPQSYLALFQIVVPQNPVDSQSQISFSTRPAVGA